MPRIKPRGFSRVPTHAVGTSDEHREYPRAKLHLTLRLKRVAGRPEHDGIPLVTRDISSSGVFFLCPVPIELGTPVELEVCLVDRPFGNGSVHMHTVGHIVRTESVEEPGWHGLAVTFDDITFQRDEPLLSLP